MARVTARLLAWMVGSGGDRLDVWVFVACCWLWFCRMGLGLCFQFLLGESVDRQTLTRVVCGGNGIGWGASR